MRHNQIIDLVTIVITEDDVGNQVEQETSRQVFANEYHVTITEFYQSGVEDLKPMKAFEIYTHEYNNEEKFHYQGQTYQVSRVQTKGEKTILTGRVTVSNGSH